MLHDITDLPYKISAPTQCSTPFVFNSPHSGNYYPSQFQKQSRLDSKALRKSEDFWVDELFASVVELGAPLISAVYPRAYIDMNREPYELDPDMFDGNLPSHVKTKSARISGGLGTIAKVVAEGENIYNKKLSVDEGLARIEEIYKPYHAALRNLLAKAVVKHKYGVLIDCHSMPSSAQNHCFNAHEHPVNAPRPTKTPAKSIDMVIGDRYGSSCSGELTHAASEVLKDLGYRIQINKPYAGGFNTEHYGRPQNGLHAIQIEINRALYMNEEKLEKTSGFELLAKDMEKFSDKIMQLSEENLMGTIPLAAE